MSKVTKRPVYANDGVLDTYAFSRSSEQLSEDLTHPAFLDSLTQPTGWKFTSFHDKILNEKGLADLTRTIKVKLNERFPSVGEDEPNVAGWIEEDSLNVNACKLHVPPMLFGNDIFRVQFGEFVLTVNGNDALLCWAAQHTKEEVRDRPLDIIKVPYAAKWTARMHDSFGTSNSSTNSSSSGGDVGGAGAGAGVSVTPTATGTPLSTGTASIDSAGLLTTGSSVVSSVRECDWTFSSDYVCSVMHLTTSVDTTTSDLTTAAVGDSRSLERIHSSVAGGVVLRAHSLPTYGETPLHTALPTTHNTTTNTPVPAAWTVQCESASEIDFEMLKNQEEPILFYDEFILYQDDLEDCGEITLEAKLRVMPQCWFLLVKQFLRVDGARVRSRESRFFHRFSDSADCTAEVKIAMDVCWRELTATPVTQTNPSHNPNHNPHPNSKPSTTLPTPAPGHVHGTHGTGTGIMAGIATGAHPGLAGRVPFSPPPQALHSTSHSNHSSAEAQLFGSQGKNLTHLIPVVNEKENINQHFSIKFTANSK